MNKNKSVENLGNQQLAESVQTGNGLSLCRGAELGKEFEIVWCWEGDAIVSKE